MTTQWYDDVREVDEPELCLCGKGYVGHQVGGNLQCYGCLLRGCYDVFGLPVRCPRCGSMEVWSA